MAKKDIDWSNLGFGYVKTDKRFVANYKNGAWDNGVITDDDKVVISECAGVLQYSQSCFEGMKAIHNREWSHSYFQTRYERKQNGRFL